MFKFDNGMPFYYLNTRICVPDFTIYKQNVYEDIEINYII